MSEDRENDHFLNRFCRLTKIASRSACANRDHSSRMNYRTLRNAAARRLAKRASTFLCGMPGRGSFSASCT